MRAYIRLRPIVLSIPSVLTQAKEFRAAYDTLQEQSGAKFPYTRLLGGGQVLNHSNYPDLYFCSMVPYEAQGALGPSGRFVRSEVTTQASKPTLEKYAKISAAGANVSAESVQAWREGARELDVKLQVRKLKCLRQGS